MTQVAIVGADTSKQECGEDAVEHVAAATATAREAMWIFDGLPEGALVFGAPLSEARAPVGWIASPQQYQAAKSRGDLEDLADAPALIFRRAGGVTLRPGIAQTNNMSTLLQNTKEAPPKTTAFYCTHRVIWRKKTYPKDTTFEVAAADLDDEILQANLKAGWIEEMRDGQRVPKPAATAAPAAQKIPQTVSAEMADTPASKAGMFLPEVPLRDIRPSPWNPRKDFTSAAAVEYLRGLAQSIREQGIIEPLIVRRSDEPGPYYELVAGECRWRAAKEAGLVGVPCIYRFLDKVAAIRQQAVENLQRRDINAMEECEGYELLMSEGGYTVKDIVRETGKSEPTVYARLKLRDCPPGIRQALVEDRLPASTAELVARVEDVTLRCAFMDAILHPDQPGEDRGGVLSFRQAKDWLGIARERVAQEAAWKKQAQESPLAKKAAKVLTAEESSKVMGYGYIKDPNKYVRPIDVCPTDPKQRTYADIARAAKRELPAPILARDMGSGKAVAILPRQETEKILEGLMPKEEDLARLRREEHERLQKERADKLAEQTAAAQRKADRVQAAVRACVDAPVWEEALDEMFLRFAVGTQMAICREDDAEEMVAALRQFGVSIEEADEPVLDDAWFAEYLDGCDTPKLRGWLLYFSVRDPMGYGDTRINDRWLAGAESLLGIEAQPRTSAVEDVA